ncbi:urease accessory protein UreF [Halieaceae bacterium IMCC14734]|uniref:Urease accessory protein UreF n=1 Tax=Candidatus Litorirhabdus singularis TaxID=2518993 RepID=A0ABT3TIW5_9GAMM|nr:urease accessory protein UreF [Candidatus Litorirhabdus singularis]MCX2982270.1 urease accessory protein UreF [Candidatus Litorirhabdus singularis]
MAITTTDSALLRLLQLSSVALPVGGYAFSQGLENAVEQGWLQDREATHDWLLDQLNYSLARVDLPLLLRLQRAQEERDISAVQYWNDYLLACRETAELRLTDTAMGEALVRLLNQLELPQPPLQTPVFAAGFAIACDAWSISPRAACHGYAWAWLENQVAAATKLVPLGQSAAQILLGQLSEQLPAAVDAAMVLEDRDIGASLPGLALASVWHETQYSRLFRS